jgi:nucleotide-binding universal stress UspA family protein
MDYPITHPGILVGVDGSAGARAAVRWAAAEAEMRNVALTIVHVINAPVPSWPVTRVPVGFGRWQEEQGREFIQDAIKVAEDSTAGGGPAQINSEVFFSATVPTLVDLSKEAEMVVVGCRGRGALARTVLGSVSSGLVHHAHCPVAVIHDEDLSRQPGEAPVLVGIDGSPASEAATAIAFDEASRRGVDLVAVHAWSDVGLSEFPDFDWSGLVADQEEMLAERLAGWQERYPDVRIRRQIVLDEPARRLVKESESAQLVVVGSHGRGGFAGMLLGSVSAAVVNGVRIPVIVARRS